MGKNNSGDSKQGNRRADDVALGWSRSNLMLEPWMVGTAEREKIWQEAKKAGKKLALYFAKKPNSSTFRYRVYNVFQATRGSKKWQAVYFYQNEMEVLKQLVEQADLLVLDRQVEWSEASELADMARRRGVPVLFDIDDLVFDKRYLGVVANTIGELGSLDYWATFFQVVNTTAGKVDGFLVTNDFLGEKISETFQRPYRVIRNSLNQEQLEASEAYLSYSESGDLNGRNVSREGDFNGQEVGEGLGDSDEREVGKNSGDFVIGYFSGSPTHMNDLMVALPEVMAFLKGHENARLRVVGMMNFDGEAAELVRRGQIETVPFTDFRKLQKLMSEVDVNIAPLVLNDFTNCKSELKFFEAAAVETVTVASPSYTFVRAIKDGKNGLLAREGEWFDKLEYLYQNPAERRRMAKQAHKDALRKYDDRGEEFLREVEGAYDYFA